MVRVLQSHWRQRLIQSVLFWTLIFSPSVGFAIEEEVDLEIVFLADASGSIDNAEIAFQRAGYAQALTHPAVLKVITGGILGRIAVSYIEWGDAQSQDVVVSWMVIDGAKSAESFADQLLTAPRRAYGYNAIGSAITVAHGEIETNTFKGLRRVIDFSADSANNWDGIPIETARRNAIADGITINGLAILCRDLDCSGRPVTYDLEQAFAEQIIGGPGHFVHTVDDRNRFAAAVRRKMILELAGPVRSNH